MEKNWSRRRHHCRRGGCRHYCRRRRRRQRKFFEADGNDFNARRRKFRFVLTFLKRILFSFKKIIFLFLTANWHSTEELQLAL